MKKILLPLISLSFLVVSSVFIALYPAFQNFIPATQVELSHGVEYGAVLKDFLFVQEITLKKRYLSRIDVYMAKLPSQYVNSNVFVLIDDQHRILFTKRFSSADFGEALHFPFEFGKAFDIGKGKTVFACIYSTDGDQQSYIGLARKANSSLGKLYVMPIVNNDILQSFEGRQSVFDFKGSLGVRTYESDSRIFSTLRIILFLLAFITSFIILFRTQIWLLLQRVKIRPEVAFGIIAATFGSLMLVLTPPFQVPDEPVHFYRTYQVAEFNFFKIRDDFPQSLKQLADSCSRMQFSTHEKTKPGEILSLAAIKTNPTNRVHAETPNYTIPYIPQAIGLFIGKIFHLNPLWLLYLGRLFNLAATILMIFLAVRITPVFKWIFVLLGILPMSLYQFASLSYDAATIGLSFLLLALIMRMAYDKSEGITRRQLLRLFAIALLLAASKPPYFLVLLAVLIIPVSRIGSLKRYIMVVTGLLISALVVSQLWGPGKKIMEKLTGASEPQELRIPGNISDDLLAYYHETSMNPLANALPLLPHSPQNQAGTNRAGEEPLHQDSQDTTSARSEAKSPVATPVPSPFNPSGQKEFILSNPFAFLGIITDTVLKSGNLYLVSIVGLFGWIDTQVPDSVAYLYLLFLILLALVSPVPGIRVGWRDKLVFLGTFLIAFVLIETALYIYCNPVGCSPITAVQGRYFIAISPLIFLLFYNTWFTGFLAGKSQPDVKNHRKKKDAMKKDHQADSGEEPWLVRAIPLAAVLIALMTLIWSVYLILDRFYVLSV